MNFARLEALLVLLAVAAAPRPASCGPVDVSAPRGRPLTLPGQPVIPTLPAPGTNTLAPAFPVPSYQPSPRRSPSYGRPPPPLPQGMTITVDKALSDPPAPDEARASAPIGRPVQAARELAKCWAPPLPAKGETVEVTIRFGFDRGGSVRWPPRITYVKAPEGTAPEILRQSILDAVKACTPLRFTPSMAASVAGYPLSVRYIGRRADEAQERR